MIDVLGPEKRRRRMPNVFTGSCARMRCCLSENLLYRHRNGHIQAEWP
uniref:Uncharacterized protein n=1 Tax=Escherichia coli TaxID=562 RepID=A0A2S1PN22_ECOLX|nr:hypothetical protein [Escherichia coli]